METKPNKNIDALVPEEACFGNPLALITGQREEAVKDQERDYRVRDILCAVVKFYLMDEAKQAAVKQRAGLIDDSWSPFEQLASERYQASMARRAERRSARAEYMKILERRDYHRNPFK